MNVKRIEERIDRASGEDLQRLALHLQIEQAFRDSHRAKFEYAQVIATLAAVAAVIVSIVVVIQGGDSLDAQRQALGQQTNAATMQDQEARYSSVSELSLDVDKAIADHPRLVPCFEAGRCQATLTSDELHQAEALAVYIVDFYQYLYAQLENLGYVPSSGLFSLRKDNASSDESWITWSETIVGGFRDSQLVCDALKNAVPAYEDRFVHAVAVTGVCPGLKQ